MEEKSKYPKIYPPCLSLSFTKKKFSALFVFSVVVDYQQQQKHTGGKKTVEIYQHMARHIAQCQVRPPADPSKHQNIESKHSFARAAAAE